MASYPASPPRIPPEGLKHASSWLISRRINSASPPRIPPEGLKPTIDTANVRLWPALHPPESRPRD